jgi:NAD(P)-dependent dehydrogenase (short-subunit alcohol dehydrogenase family)
MSRAALDREVADDERQAARPRERARHHVTVPAPPTVREDVMTRLSEKVVLVTGATSGIGRAAARLFVERGAAVVLGGRRADEGERLVGELRAHGGRAVFRPTDVTKPADNEALVASALSSFGQLDVAFDNAGVYAYGPLAEVDEALYTKVFGTNVWGILSSIRAQLPSLIRSRGSIILTSSVAGSRGVAEGAVYVASKHAVEGIMRSAALELAPLGVRVNVVAPGPTVTDMLDRDTASRLTPRVPLGRAATAEEVAEAAVWLASDEARFVTGAVIPVDGGMTA